MIFQRIGKDNLGEEVLFYDSGIHDENKIVVFTTDENIFISSIAK